MRMPLRIHIKNTAVVNSVNSDFTVGVNNIIVVHNDANVDYTPSSLSKKAKSPGSLSSIKLNTSP